MNQNSAPQIPGVMLYLSVYDALKDMPKEDVGALLLALMEYALYGVIPDFTGINAMAWNFIRSYADADRKRYEMTVARRRAAAEKRWEKGDKKAPPSPPLTSTSAPLASTSGGGGRATARSEGACSGVAAAPPVSPAASQPPRRWGQDTALPQEKKEEQTFGNIEWMENHVYRDEKGVIRYR